MAILMLSYESLASNEGKVSKIDNKEEVKVVDDILISPTYTADSAGMIKNIIAKKLPFGIYHVANAGQSTWYDFSKRIFETLDMQADLSPTKTNILQSKAKRPMFSPLNSIRLKNHGLEMESWETVLESYLIEKGHLKCANSTTSGKKN